MYQKQGPPPVDKNGKSELPGARSATQRPPLFQCIAMREPLVRHTVVPPSCAQRGLPVVENGNGATASPACSSKPLTTLKRGLPKVLRSGEIAGRMVSCKRIPVFFARRRTPLRSRKLILHPARRTQFGGKLVHDRKHAHLTACL